MPRYSYGVNYPSPYGPNCNGPYDKPATRYGAGLRSILPPAHIATTGQLLLRFMMRIDELDFVGEGPQQEYCYPIECGEPGAFEWALRLYRTNSSRPNHLSAYAFNYDGGFGAGARFGSPLANYNTWYEVAVGFDLINDRIDIAVDGSPGLSGEQNFTYHKNQPDQRRIFPRPVGPGIRLGGRNVDAPISLCDIRIEDSL
jgi:hypothetical protein